MGSSIRLTHTDLTDAIRTARKMLDHLERDLPQLMARSQQADGFPAGGGQGHSSTVSDPTLSAVMLRENGKTTDAGRALHRLWVGTLTLSSADSFRAQALPPGTKEQNINDPSIWCSHCVKHKHNEPVHANGVCRWCYDFNRSFEQLPPLSLLEIHWRGKRPSERDYRAAGMKVKVTM